MKTEILLKETLINFLVNMAVDDYCHLGNSIIWRTRTGFAIEDNGEEVETGSAARALEIAIENETE